MLLTGMWTVRVSWSVHPLVKKIEKWKESELTQLDNVANNSHDQEAHADGLGNAQELALVGCERRDVSAGLARGMLESNALRGGGRGGSRPPCCERPRMQETLYDQRTKAPSYLFSSPCEWGEGV